MLQKLKRHASLLVYRSPKWRIWKVVSSVGNGLKFHRKFLRAAYLVQFYLFSLLTIYCVCIKEKVLGVVISDKLTWDLHLHLITAKANKLLGLLKRSCPMLTKVAVSKSMIIKQLWNPTFVTLQKSRVSRSEVTKTWGWTSSEAYHQMDFKFDDWPNVIWGDTACLALR